MPATLSSPVVAGRFARTALTVLIVLCLATGASAQAEPADRANQINHLHAVLQSEAGRLQKIQACKQLAAVGTGDSVSVLTPMLRNEELSHAARIALEAIADPSAGKALRDAIPQLDGLLLVGVINSLGARRDAASVAALHDLLLSEDAQAASAAALALGRIATNEAAGALMKSLATASPALQTATAQGCLLAAQRCRRDGRGAIAKELCEQIIKSQCPQYIKLAAIRGALLADDTIDPARLAALIRDDDETGFAMALTVVRESPGDAVTQVIAPLIDQAPAERQVLLITALADRGDASALLAVLAATESQYETVRSAAIRALAHFTQESVAAKLLDMACSPDGTSAEAARNALLLSSSPALDSQILQRLPRADGKARIVLYALIGGRHITDGVPALLKGADAEDLPERVAAITALGKTIPASQLNILTSRFLATSSPEELEAIKGALQASCVRLGDAETCAREIVACLPKTTGPLQLQLYELLGVVGGPTALQAVAAASKKPDPDMQDTISRVLGQWMTPDAAPLLLELAQSQNPEKYRIRALRGYIRILRQFDMTNRQRIDMCRHAMPLAKRTEERLLMLEALLRVPARETLSLALTQLDAAEVRHRACEVALILSNALAERNPEAVIEAMDKVLETTDDETFKTYARQLRTRAQKK